MSDADDKKAGVPEWQRAQPSAASAATEPTPSSSTEEAPVSIQQAKRFLQDDEVRKYPREKKIEFLKGKGLEEDVVQQLLREEDSAKGASQKPIESEPQTIPTPSQASDIEAEPQTLPTPSQPQNIEAEPQTLPTPSHSTSAQPASQKEEDRPPIVTYPEFLTKPTRPPPLMTVTRFLNTLYAFGGLSALVYGTSKFVVSPMVDNLTEARLSLHDTAKDNLSRLLEKLEATVSEIPPTSHYHKHDAPDNKDSQSVSSEYDDPTELFHRDIGVQTSLPPSPNPNPNINPYGQYTSSSFPPPPSSSSDPAEHQACRIGELVSSLREVDRGFKSESEDYDDVRALVGVFQDELDEMGRTANSLVGGSSLYGFGRSVEPDDEIKRAKENVRRVKGVLLSARSFPAGR